MTPDIRASYPLALEQTSQEIAVWVRSNFEIEFYEKGHPSIPECPFVFMLQSRYSRLMEAGAMNKRTNWMVDYSGTLLAKVRPFGLAGQLKLRIN